MQNNSKALRLIGLMSGTSLDGVDAVLAHFSADTNSFFMQIEERAYLAFDDALRAQLLALQNTIHYSLQAEASAAFFLTQHYAQCVEQLLAKTKYLRTDIAALAVHGQTILHHPHPEAQQHFTRQIHQPALLAELTHIDVITDFRSRDMAAGGQGAPLVPKFHQAIFADEKIARVVVNIGGIANITVLPNTQEVFGFDTGPGNMLLDIWYQMNHVQNITYDLAGQWARGGRVIDALLKQFLQDDFFAKAPPKSTGREHFHKAWLLAHLENFKNESAQNIQTTLVELTAITLCDAIKKFVPGFASCAQEIIIAGGGVKNEYLLERLRTLLAPIKLDTPEHFGLQIFDVEAAAFAWLGYCFLQRKAVDYSTITGAKGPRILGALYPA